MKRKPVLPPIDRRQRKKAEAICEACGNTVYNIAAGILKDRFLADDAVQETFVRMLENIDKVSGENINMTKNYLAVICRRVCFDILKKNAAEAGREVGSEDTADDFADIPPPEGDILPLDAVLNGEMREKIIEAVKALPSPNRDAFLMHFVYGHTVAETAAILGVGAETVKKRYARAKALLRKRLEAYVYG